MDAGLDPLDFWRVTPREYTVILEGAVHRIQREEKLTAWLAWHTASLGRIDSKKFPKYREFMGNGKKQDKSKRRQSWEEMLSVAQRWTAAVNRMEQNNV